MRTWRSGSASPGSGGKVPLGANDQAASGKVAKRVTTGSRNMPVICPPAAANDQKRGNETRLPPAFIVPTIRPTGQAGQDRGRDQRSEVRG